jgi:zinc protease
MIRRRLFPLAAALPLAAAACAPSAAPPASPGTVQTPPTPGALRPYRLPAVEDFTLPNGMRVVVVPQATVPLVAARVIVDAGSEFERAEQGGLAVLTGTLLAEGTRELTGPELAERMERLGAQFQTGASYSLAFASVTALRPALPEALRLAAGAVMHPTFPENEVARVRQQAIAAHVQSMATVEGLAGEAFSRAVYTPDAPYARPPGGTAETLAGLTRDDVAGWHRAMYAPANTTLLLVGAVTAGEARRLAEEAFGGWAATAAVPPRPASRARPAERARVILVDRPGSVQSAIRIGQGSIGAEDPDFFRMTALSQVLGGGFNARINQNLRERHGWTYGAFTNFAALRGAGSFAITSSVMTTATDSALVESVREFRRIVQEPVPPDELHGALNNLVGSFPASVMTTQGLAQRMQTVLLYGLPLDYYSTYRERLAAVTPGDVAGIGRERLTPDALTIVVAGDLAAIEAPIRALGLGDVEVWSPAGERVR